MDINLELYKTFYVVANAGSLTKASQILYVSQPAITKSIKQLEERLGGKLFHRIKSGICLTEEGKIFYEYIHKSMENIKNAENIFTSLINLDCGSIRIGVSTTVTKYFLMPYIESFHKLYPNIEIKIINELTQNLYKKLINGEVDILIVNLPTKETSNTKIIPCAIVHDIFVTSDKYSYLSKNEIKLEELFKNTMIVQKSPSNTRNFLDDFLMKNKIEFKPSIEIVSYNLVIDFVKKGFGIGYATKEFLNDELNNKQLFEIKTIPEIPSRELGIVILNNNIQSFATNKLMECILNKKIDESKY